jgi:hypothetical protein
MKVFKLSDMRAGWFVGDFEPSCLKLNAFEIACKRYRAGDTESRHVHKVATEITLVVAGRVRMNGVEFVEGDIVMLDSGEPTDFHSCDDTITVVLKLPSIVGDKYPA